MVTPRPESRQPNFTVKKRKQHHHLGDIYSSGWKSGVPFPLAAYLPHDLEGKIKVNFTLLQSGTISTLTSAVGTKGKQSPSAPPTKAKYKQSSSRPTEKTLSTGKTTRSLRLKRQDCRDTSKDSFRAPTTESLKL